MNICTYSYEEFLHLVKSFHGTLAPGLLIGGFMVDLAMKNLPEGELFDAICETPVCLPDAVQILTPCTIGNGWLSVVPFGKFAVTLYEKYSGKGVRVYLDMEKLFGQIREAGHGLLSIQHVQVAPEKVRRKKMGPVAVCPVCNEAFPTRDGDKCRSCQGDTPYSNIVSVAK